MKLCRGRVPPLGFHFEVAPGVKLEAGTEEILTKLIFEYRLRHNIAVGDIERDIDNYYCAKWPDACSKEASDWNPGAPGTPSYTEPMINRVTRWASLLLNQLPAGGYTLAAQEEADRRSAICANCRYNTAWRGGCSGCSESTSAVVAQLRQLRKSKTQGNLMACSIGGWENGTAVWLGPSQMEATADQRTAMPDACWRKHL